MKKEHGRFLYDLFELEEKNFISLDRSFVQAVKGREKLYDKGRKKKKKKERRKSFFLYAKSLT